jgi:sporulation protein YlmC with PRC-barrel domain
MRLLASIAAIAMLTSAAAAQTKPQAAAETAPADQFTVTNYYKQDVYDRADNKIGTIDDVLIDKEGKVTALIVGVGGFLGIGQKDVSEPFSRVQMVKKNDKWYLVMDADKEALKRAVGLTYDRSATTWVPENAERDRTKSR